MHDTEIMQMIIRHLTKMIHFFLFMLFATLAVAQDFSSNTTFTKVHYGKQQISVWKQKDTYFVSPLGYLNTDSLTYGSPNTKSPQRYLEFDIILINNVLRREVSNHLRLKTGDCVTDNDIQLMPTKTINVSLKSQTNDTISISGSWDVPIDPNAPDSKTLQIDCKSHVACILYISVIRTSRIVELLSLIHI